MTDETSGTFPIHLRLAQFDPGSVFASPRDNTRPLLALRPLLERTRLEAAP